MIGRKLMMNGLLLLQAYWVTEDGDEEAQMDPMDDVDLEIDEVSSLTAAAAASSGSKILERRASKVIYKETESPARYNCPIWTQGLERTFRVRQIPLIKGDFRQHE